MCGYGSWICGSIRAALGLKGEETDSLRCVALRYVDQGQGRDGGWGVCICGLAIFIFCLFV